MHVNVHEAKTHLSQLLARVERGEEITIGRAGKPVAKLEPYRQAAGRRRPGAWKGRVRIAADFEELSPDITAAFRGESS